MPPIYLYSCECGVEKDEFHTVAERNNSPEHCGKPMRMKFCAPSIMDDIKPYKNMVDGKLISSRSQHRNFLKKHDLIEVGNEVEHMLKPRPKMKLSKDKRRQRIAEILNNR